MLSLLHSPSSFADLIPQVDVYKRQVHSLIEALVRYTNVKFILISPEELRIPSYIREDVLKKNNICLLYTSVPERTDR